MKSTCIAVLSLLISTQAFSRCLLSLKTDENLRLETARLMTKKGYKVTSGPAGTKLVIRSQAEYERSCEKTLDAWIFTSVDFKRSGSDDIHFEDVFSFTNNSMNEKKNMKRKNQNLKKLTSFLPDCPH